MDTNMTRLIAAFAGREVLVIGDAMLDSYLTGTAGALCREAPVPVVTLSHRHNRPGGAANTAANIQSLDGRVTLLAVVGDDLEAALLRQSLAARGISDTTLVVEPGRQTLAKHRVMTPTQLLVRFDTGSTGSVTPPTERVLLDRLAELFSQAEAVIVSDYGYGVLTPRIIAALAELQALNPTVLVADARDLTAYHAVGVTVVKPNYNEAIQLLGNPICANPTQRAQQIEAHGEQLLERTGAQIAAVTLDSEGAIILERGQPAHRTYARPVANPHPAGAGDTFVSVLALALAAGAIPATAAELASRAATIVVAKDGTATCEAGELRAAIGVADKYVADLDLLAACVEQQRRQGRRVVFTNGCFDILHSGHITYLSQAKAQGDLLIVGVNSDASIRRLKGPRRPIVGLEDRIQVLAALSCVDYLIAFDDDTPVRLIRDLRPDIFVKGGDYTLEQLPEAAVMDELGGEVRILSYLPDRSTTGIIERIRDAYDLVERAVGA